MTYADCNSLSCPFRPRPRASRACDYLDMHAGRPSAARRRLAHKASSEACPVGHRRLCRALDRLWLVEDQLPSDADRRRRNPDRVRLYAGAVRGGLRDVARRLRGVVGLRPGRGHVGRRALAAPWRGGRHCELPPVRASLRCACCLLRRARPGQRPQPPAAIRASPCAARRRAGGELGARRQDQRPEHGLARDHCLEFACRHVARRPAPA